jgi:hypothetical protein
MATIATIAANSWSISIGGGWIVLMLVGLGLCFVFMLGFMWLMRDGRGWTMCGRWWQHEPPLSDVLADTFTGRADSTISPESEGPR